jgi:hypothetical protein
MKLSAQLLSKQHFPLIPRLLARLEADSEASQQAEI